MANIPQDQLCPSRVASENPAGDHPQGTQGVTLLSGSYSGFVATVIAKHCSNGFQRVFERHPPPPNSVTSEPGIGWPSFVKANNVGNGAEQGL